MNNDILLILGALVLVLIIVISSLGASLRDAQEQIKWLQHRLEELQNERATESRGGNLALSMIFILIAAVVVLLVPRFLLPAP
jgi:hypothetical protein